jgi:PAS domain S-box-containing protein
VFRQSIIRDITERRRAQLALEQSEARFRKVVESAPEAIVVEREGVIQYVNLVALGLLGVSSPADVVGRQLSDFIHPDEREDSRRRSDAVAQGLSVPFVERRYVRPDGEIITAENSAVPIDYDRQPASLIFFRDISERKKSEEERTQLEAQLRQAQKMESIGRLAGGVAHDFNNHLTVINGYCDMLLRDAAEDDPVREALEEIRTAGERASALTQQLLAFSRKQMTEAKPMRLNDMVAEAERMIRRLIGEDIDVVTKLSPEPAVIMADRGQMNQVLMNLAVNARDAMPRGGRLTIETGSAEVDDLYVALHPEAKAGLYATLSVSDSGVGMSPDTLQRIFEPFFTTKATGRGTGLGLATVYGIVKQRGGWIRVYSEVGKGSHFQLFFPRAERTEAEPDSLPDNAGQRGSETLLVVEDQAEVRHLTLAILRKHGYKLLEAADGASALEICAEYQDPIHLLLTDVVMPGMNGRELAGRLLELRPGLKVLYTSGYTAEAIGREGVLEHGVAYLPKPFSITDLTAKVREVLDSDPGRLAAHRQAAV